MIDGAKASADENTIAFGITLVYDAQQLETRADRKSSCSRSAASFGGAVVVLRM
jgi:hypothetical protein